MRVNLTTKVNRSQIRKITHNGREHWVLPSYTLPANVVMNGGLYPSSEIDTHYRSLEGTLAPLGHPMVNGEYVSAFSPEGINLGHVGAWNRNVKKSGNRIYVEKWVDIEVAKSSEGGKELLDRVEALDRGEDVPPIHTSVGVYLTTLEASEDQKKDGIEWVAKIETIDHDAILLHEPGAATPEQGVGLLVNTDTARLVTSSGVLIGESYREKESRLDRAAKQKFAPNPDEYVWIADFTDSQVIVVKGGIARVYGYKTEGINITFDDVGVEVIRDESWIAVVANSIKKLFNKQSALPTINQEGDMPITKEERAELTKDISEAVAANMNQTVGGILNSLSEKLTSLEVNHKQLSEMMMANSKAKEAEKRKEVAAKLGDVVANALTGEALDAAYKQLGESSSLISNSGGEPQKVKGVPDVNNYFPQEVK